MVTMVCVCVESVSSVEGGPKGTNRRRVRRFRQRSSTPTTVSKGNITKTKKKSSRELEKKLMLRGFFFFFFNFWEKLFAIKNIDKS